MRPTNVMHWNNVYNTKQPNEVSWTQEIPKTSLNFIRSFNLPKASKIIDVGGGDGRLVDFLLDEGYENITVLDISESALKRAEKRLGKKAESVKWIVTDVVEFEPQEDYDLWHDRAAFHFLTLPEQIKKYTSIVNKYVQQYLVVGTFSNLGPKKCSGLDVKQYSTLELAEQFQSGFQAIESLTEDHTTPFHTQQNFVFCSFKKTN